LLSLKHIGPFPDRNHDFTYNSTFSANPKSGQVKYWKIDTWCVPG